MNYHKSAQDLNTFISWSRNSEVRKRRKAKAFQKLAQSLKQTELSFRLMGVALKPIKDFPHIKNHTT